MNPQSLVRMSFVPLVLAAGLLVAAPVRADRDEARRDDRRVESDASERRFAFDNHYGRDVRFEVQLESRDGSLALRGRDGRSSSRVVIGSVGRGRRADVCVTRSSRASGRSSCEGNVRVNVFDSRTGRCINRRVERVCLSRNGSCSPRWDDHHGDRDEHRDRDSRHDDRDDHDNQGHHDDQRHGGRR